MSYNYSPKIVTDGLEFYVDSANPKSYTSGSTIENDLVGSQDMILNNGVSYSADNLGSLEFDGIDDFCQTANVYTRSECMSWDVWFMRTGDVGSHHMIYSHYLPYFSFRGASSGVVNQDKFLFSFFTVLSSVATQQYIYSQNTYLDNTWYNACCTLETNTTTGTADAKMYVNGELENSINLPGTVDSVYSASYSLRLGRWSLAQPYPFEGKIPSLKIYNKILSADEVKQNFNAIKTRFGL
jgi:hypothetical protein